MMRILLSSMILTLLLAGTGLSAFAHPQNDANRCFLPSQFETWKAPDTHTILIRVNFKHYYRLDLAGTCSELRWPDAHLITHFNTGAVCNGLDWDLRVKRDIPGMSQPCIVKSMTPIPPAEVAAMPASIRP